MRQHTATSIPVIVDYGGCRHTHRHCWRCRTYVNSRHGISSKHRGGANVGYSGHTGWLPDEIDGRELKELLTLDNH